MIASTEDRHSPRTRSQFPVRFEVIPFDGRGFVDAHVEDLSPDGLRFQCQDEVSTRSGMLLELLIPDAQPVRLVGRAAWVRELPNHSGFEVGSRFEDQSARGRKTV